MHPECVARNAGNRARRFALRGVIFFAPFAACALLLAVAAHAQEQTFALDPAQTQIRFSLGSTLHTVHGTFALESGKVRLDPATGQASGEIVVAAASGNSGNKGRDHKMQTKVLESAKYPQIIFSLRHIEGRLTETGASDVQVSGEFKIHGATHELTIPAHVQRDGAHVLVAMEFQIPYVRWGMKDPSTFFLRADKEVKLEIEARGVLEDSSAAD